MNKYLSYSLIPFLLVLAFCSLASKQEDGFRINVGDEFYSEIIELNKGKLVGKTELKEIAEESAVKQGYECVKYVTYFDNTTNSRYCRTDSSGLYFYFEKYINDYSELFPELNNFWLKYIDFQNEEWTQFSLVYDTTYRANYSINLELTYGGKLISEEEVEFNGKKYDAKVVSSVLRRKETVDYEGEIEVHNSEIGMEFTYIDGIGIYKSQRLYDDSTVEWYQVLKSVE